MYYWIKWSPYWPRKYILTTCSTTHRLISTEQGYVNYRYKKPLLINLLNCTYKQSSNGLFFFWWIRMTKKRFPAAIGPRNSNELNEVVDVLSRLFTVYTTKVVLDCEQSLSFPHYQSNLEVWAAKLQEKKTFRNCLTGCIVGGGYNQSAVSKRFLLPVLLNSTYEEKKGTARSLSCMVIAGNRVRSWCFKR